MAGFSQTTLSGLTIPSSDGIAEQVNASLASGPQVTSNFGLPSTSTLESEALQKVASTGIGSGFTAISPSISLTNQSGAVVATNNDTNTTIGTIQPAVDSNPVNQTAASTSTTTTNAKKVILTQEPVVDAYSTVVFDAMPVISEGRTANYKSFTPIQHPGEILKYEGSSSRTWNISVKLVSRNPAEALANLNKINTIRSWVMPFYGQGTADDATGSGEKAYLGAPPPIITLKAYGPTMIGPVKTIVESYSWDFPNDVDYINTPDGTPFPVIMSVTIALKESWSPAEYSGFDYVSYKQGNMGDAFKKVAVQNTASAQSNSPTIAASGAGSDRSSASSINQSDAETGRLLRAAKNADTNQYLADIQKAQDYGDSVAKTAGG